jgi:hypothetical protein
MRLQTDSIQDCPTSRYGRRQLRLDDIDNIQALDSDQPVDDVGVALRRLCISRPHLLEAQVVPHEPTVSRWLHRHGSLLHLRHRILHRLQNCAGSSCLYLRHLRGTQPVRLPDQVRLHKLDAVPIRRPLGVDSVRLHVGFLPVQQQGRARLWHRLRPDFLRLHPGRHADDHAPLPRRGGDCCGHLAVSRCHQPVPCHFEDLELAEQQLRYVQAGGVSSTVKLGIIRRYIKDCISQWQHARCRNV